MKYMREVRSALFIALAVFLAMQILLAVLQPYLIYILIGLVLTVVGMVLYGRATRL
ncbi:hypothetical protein [Arthrobacter sp. OY3WO11]|uniref:hypothetical protein n=1 Tax=Arthrobacter sp. OY3WO11 TaxID=1835723 RepID=UPI000A904148|nr:hypothetical protein [Arthrobacter sp. OY3WO11]